MTSLKNKIALVTGGGQGLGEEICLSLAEVGVNVIIADLKEIKAKTLAEKIKKKGGRAQAVYLDVANENNVDDVFNVLIARYGQLDILINNAGTDAEPKPLEQYTVLEFDRVLGVNLRGPFILSRKALSLMYKRNSGHIVNIGSTASIKTWPNASLYHISKAALRGLGWSLFTELREKKSAVRVSTIIPGGMKTAHIVERFPEMDFSWLQDPKNVAKIVKFVLEQPDQTVIPEIVAIPPLEWSLP